METTTGIIRSLNPKSKTLNPNQESSGCVFLLDGALVWQRSVHGSCCEVPNCQTCNIGFRVLGFRVYS